MRPPAALKASPKARLPRERFIRDCFGADAERPSGSDANKGMPSKDLHFCCENYHGIVEQRRPGGGYEAKTTRDHALWVFREAQQNLRKRRRPGAGSFSSGIHLVGEDGCEAEAIKESDAVGVGVRIGVL